MKLVLYSKPGCHLCEGLEDKLLLVTQIPLEIEIRDIMTREDWFNAYQYEVPVMCHITSEGEKPLPRVSPRASVGQLEKLLSRYATNSED